ncbi:hypothetical protein B0T19DRAFT_417073 [Cercophora scortea]|uniref:Aminoglycoside phosphotransferase domain-containing protein n=1 Tax=Cercophora scortea TaxID=314031 RepID=A0AAE0IXH2_9PEZI|nr:hypothetical protein B0T19DRAFT_417073 [Cercophora scortea]
MAASNQNNEPTEKRPHVNDSIEQIDDSSWLIGGRMLLSRQQSLSSEQPSWSDGKGAFFVISDAPTPRPSPRSVAGTEGEIPRVYDADDLSAVWRAGEAFIKVQNIAFPQATREHVTLQFLEEKGKLDFEYPRALHHAEFDGRYYLIVSRVSGRTLQDAWPSMNEPTRQHYVSLVAQICDTMATWKGNLIAGVDGRHLPERRWTSDCDVPYNFEPPYLVELLKSMGMDTSASPVFYHTDLGPGNILVEPEKRSIAIIDWETAGYVTREWVRTKFLLSSGMDFATEDWSPDPSWRFADAARLGEMGYADACEGWRAVFK